MSFCDRSRLNLPLSGFVSGFPGFYLNNALNFGQIVLNRTNYPNFLRFLNLYPDLRARLVPTEMEFSVSRDSGSSEWAFKGFRSIFCRLENVLDRNTWRMMYDILRFNACARKFIMKRAKNGSDGITVTPGVTIGQYLEREGYSQAFGDNMLIVCRIVSIVSTSSPPEPTLSPCWRHCIARLQIDAPRTIQ